MDERYIAVRCTPSNGSEGPVMFGVYDSRLDKLTTSLTASVGDVGRAVAKRDLAVQVGEVDLDFLEVPRSLSLDSGDYRVDPLEENQALTFSRAYDLAVMRKGAGTEPVRTPRRRLF